MNAGAKAVREKALEAYYANPRVCAECQMVIRIREGEKPHEVRRRKFCSQACAASFNNKARGRKRAVCQNCGRQFHDRHYKDRKFCSRRCYLIGRKPRVPLVMSHTKGDVVKMNRTRNRAHCAIRRGALWQIKHNGDRSKCIVCGYDTYVEVCHLKPIGDFPDSALVSDINALSNLVVLCPNHHKELDLGLLKLNGAEEGN